MAHISVKRGGVSAEELPASTETTSKLAAEPAVYISEEGSDSNTGLGPGQAFRTAKKATEYLEALAVKAGTMQFLHGKWNEAIKRLSGVNVYGKGGRNEASIIELPAATEGNVLQDASWGSPSAVGTGGEIDHICILGGYLSQTFTAPSTLVTKSVSVTSAGVTLEVLSIANFATASGSLLWVGEKLCTYTGVSGSTFTGVKPANGTTFTATVEMLVQPGAGVGHGIAIQSAYTIIGKDVYVNHCVGHGIAVQGAGETGSNAFEVVIEAKRTETNKGYGIAILPFAPDGTIAKTVASGSLGALLNMSSEWEYSRFHPVGVVQGAGGSTNLNRALVRLTRRDHQFSDLNLDSFAYDGILVDTLAANQNMSDIQIRGFCQHACFASSNAGSLVSYYGAGASPTAERLMLEGSFPGRIDRVLAPSPRTYLVGEQNLKTISEAKGKVQLLNALGISPSSTLGGVLKLATGDELSYTKPSSVGTTVKTAATSGATVLELASTSGLAASGIVTVSSATTTNAPVAALKVKYGKITGLKLEECTGITENIAAGTGAAQHFAEGVEGGTTVAAADGTSVVQSGREVKLITGEANPLTGAATVAGEGGPFNTIPVAGYGVRFTAEPTTPTGEGENIVVQGVGGGARKFVGALSGNGVATKFKVKHNLETRAVISTLLTEGFEEPVTMLAKVVSISASEVEVTFTIAPGAKAIFYVVIIA